MTTEVKNVDDILVPREQAMIANAQIPAQPANEVKEQVQEPKKVDVPIEKEVPQEEPESLSEAAEEENVVEATDKTDKIIDEYGNPVEKPRMYTEEELQQRIRERLSRGRHADQPTQQQVQQASDGFKPDPNSEDSWEQQLEAFVDRTIEKRERNLSEKQWRAQEQARQAEFEAKFTSGMGKYQDFHQVVAGKPITDTMMLAARNLNDPAAFIYGASKLHPQELERISRIADPYAQAAEVGRLHEKMVKAKKTASQAGKPLEAPKGDVPQKVYSRPSLETLIDQHAKQKRAR